MSDIERRGARPRAPLSDLFATAVHRFGNAWADLVVATAVAVAVATVPVLAVSSRSGPSDVFVASAFAYAGVYARGRWVSAPLPVG